MKSYSRFELIDSTGRRVVLRSGEGAFEAHEQDDGKTLKVFVRYDISKFMFDNEEDNGVA